MNASIIELSDGVSLVVCLNQDGESKVFDLALDDCLEDAGLNDSDSVAEYLVFSYSLLGEPNTEDDDAVDVGNTENDVEEYQNIDEHSFAGI